jgi:signal transduction histidine kinase
VQESIKGLQPWLEKKQVQIVCDETPVTLAVDRWQMKQVFDNLLSNAVYFSPQTGRVTCNWMVFRDEVLVNISDQGAGLSEEDLKQAFTPFYSRRPGGTGLGLAIAKKSSSTTRAVCGYKIFPVVGHSFPFLSLAPKLFTQRD